MKLFSFTTVKDEADIIESFVRYNLNILDGMVISDNCSNDNTDEILLKLKKEGLNIYLLRDENAYFDQTIKRQYLMDYTFNEFDPDIVFPLDADEFIAAKNGKNPRELIEKLDSNMFYRYQFQNFVIDKDDNLSELFIPNRIVNRRVLKDNKGLGYKSIIMKKVYNAGINLQMGGHNLRSKETDSIIESIIIDDLFLAHYPVRGKYQLMNKVIAGRLNNSSLHSRSEGLGFHQYDILDEIINHGTISDDTLLKISKYYGVSPLIKRVSVRNMPLSVSFCNNIKIKYSNNNYDQALLSNVIKTSEVIIDRMRINSEDLNKEIAMLRQKILELEKQIETLKFDNNQILNSKSWKITKPLRMVSKIIRGKNNERK